MISQIAEFLHIDGRLQASEMDMLFRMGIGKKCLEIGSWKGLSSFCIALGAESLKCVDTFCADGAIQSPTYTTLEDFKRNMKRFNHITIFAGTSLEASKIDHEMYDFIFIDAGHEYEDVKQDYNLWWSHLNPKGVMAFHDYTDYYTGTKRFINETFGFPVSNIIGTLVWVVKK